MMAWFCSFLEVWLEAKREKRRYTASVRLPRFVQVDYSGFGKFNQVITVDGNFSCVGFDRPLGVLEGTDR